MSFAQSSVCAPLNLFQFQAVDTAVNAGEQGGGLLSAVEAATVEKKLIAEREDFQQSG